MQTEESFIKELQEEIHNEAIYTFLSNHWKKIVMGICGILFVTVIYAVAHNSIEKRNQKYADQLQLVFTNSAKTPDQIRSELEVIYNDKKAPSEITAITGMYLGAAYMQNNQAQDALRVYQEISQNKKVDAFYRDLSSIFAVSILINTEKATDNDVNNLVAKLEKSDTGLKDLAFEQKAIYQYSKTDYKGAKTTANLALENSEITYELKSRLEQLVDLANSKIAE